MKKHEKKNMENIYSKVCKKKKIQLSIYERVQSLEIIQAKLQCKTQNEDYKKMKTTKNENYKK